VRSRVGASFLRVHDSCTDFLALAEIRRLLQLRREDSWGTQSRCQRRPVAQSRQHIHTLAPSDQWCQMLSEYGGAGSYPMLIGVRRAGWS
jgi:hypothetical protein